MCEAEPFMYTRTLSAGGAEHMLETEVVIGIVTGVVAFIAGSAVTRWYAKGSDRSNARLVVELKGKLARVEERLTGLNKRLAIDGRSEDRTAVDVLRRNLSCARQIVESEEFPSLKQDILQDLKDCVKRADNVMSALAMDL